MGGLQKQAFERVDERNGEQKIFHMVLNVPLWSLRWLHLCSNFMGKPLKCREGVWSSLCPSLLSTIGVSQTKMRAADGSGVATGEPQGDRVARARSGFVCLFVFCGVFLFGLFVPIEQREIFAPPAGLIMEVCWMWTTAPCSQRFKSRPGLELLPSVTCHQHCPSRQSCGGAVLQQPAVKPWVGKQCKRMIIDWVLQ